VTSRSEIVSGIAWNNDVLPIPDSAFLQQQQDSKEFNIDLK
jgi:hypothetical protein